ncbi:MAG TPA: DedA family protein [Anaerolineaceae bacterium]|nr:DedA family protein [Anaerolineaceae bacterium]HPN54034.1 DedA family protein [Anaerolineaceae bacterium]
MFLVDLVLHLDKHLSEWIGILGNWTYIMLFGVIFIETGVVIMPFLPGDSLLFAAGTLAALPASETGFQLNVVVLYIVLALAAVVGDTANYWIGHKLGPRVFNEKIPFLKKEYLDKTHNFYEKHGNITIFLARFIPIIRTFAPFVAGIGSMSYGKFISYNIFGGIVWTALFIFGGYFFGNIPFVRDNFSLVIIAIVVISVLPAVFEVIKAKRQQPATPKSEIKKEASQADS